MGRTRISFRVVGGVLGVASLGSFLLASCSSASSTPSADAGVSAGPFDAGSTTPTPTPIRHVVVILKENRTFDNYFTGLPGADTTTQARIADGGTIRRPPAPAILSCSIEHSYAHAIDAYNDGGMDRFGEVEGCGSEGLRPFYAYGEAQIPNYWKYARNFAISDRFFATVTGPSTPGHLSLVAGYSPAYENPLYCRDSSQCGCLADPTTVIPTFDPTTGATKNVYPCFDVPSIVDALPAGFTWKAYGSGTGTQTESTFNFIKSIGTDAAGRAAHSGTLDQFSAEMGTEAQANLVYAFVGPGPISEGPPRDPCDGENYTVNAVNKIMQSPLWKETLVVVTWDDWGGNYDHVAPPVEKYSDGSFYSLGFRLPLLLISPYARAAVVHTPTEQASVLKLVEDLWGMPRLAKRNPAARDERAGSLMEAFDFTAAARPPMVLPPRTCP